MAKRKTKPDADKDESKPKDRADRPRGGREGGGHFVTVTDKDGDRHAVYIKGPAPANMKRGGMPESVQRHLARKGGGAIRARQGSFRERVEAAKAATQDKRTIQPHSGQRTTMSAPHMTRQGRLESLSSRASRHAHAAQRVGDKNSDALFARASRLQQAELDKPANAGRPAYERKVPVGPSLREQAAAHRATKGSPEERARGAALARTMRDTIRNPPPIQAVSAKQQGYAEDVRRSHLESLRLIRLPHEPAASRATRFRTLQERAKIAGMSDAREVLDRLGRPKPPNPKAQMIEQARQERVGMSPEDIKASADRVKYIPARRPTTETRPQSPPPTANPTAYKTAVIASGPPRTPASQHGLSPGARALQGGTDMRRAASARRREENKAALVSDLERTRAEADTRQQARRDAISASFAESAMRADQRRQAMAPVPPERPTLREQAAAARAKKGTPQERARRIIERIDVRANSVAARASKFSQQSRSADKRAYDATRSRSRTLREKLAAQGKTREQHAAEIKQRGYEANTKAMRLHGEESRLRSRAERVALTQGLPNPNPTRDAYYSLAREMADAAPRGSFIRKVAAKQRRRDLQYNRMMREYRRTS